jgi:hypothetical protein
MSVHDMRGMACRRWCSEGRCATRGVSFNPTVPTQLVLSGLDRGVQLGPLTVIEVVVIDQRDPDLGSVRQTGRLVTLPAAERFALKGKG